jgi:hypothetical protein
MSYALLLAETGVRGEARSQLDRDLGVAGWPTPAQATAAAPRALEPVAATPDDDGRPPAWWGESEEDVSQAFLAELGVDLD